MPEDMIGAGQAGTLYRALQERVRRSPDAVAIRQFDRAAQGWTSATWAGVKERADRMADALAALGLAPGTPVAVLLPNGLDWVAFDMAGHRQGLPVVGLYTNETPANLAHVVGDAKPGVVLVESARRWRDIAALLPEDARPREVWTAEPDTPGEDGATVPLAQVLARPVPAATPPEVDPGQTAALVYTSGTTGAPKGAMLSHRALLSNAAAVHAIIPPVTEDVFLSILPLAHAFERTVGYVLPVMSGACVAYAPSLLRLRQDLATIRPTVIVGVPRFYEAIYQAARRAVEDSDLKRALFDRTAAIGYRRFAHGAGLGPAPSLLDRLAWPVLARIVARKVMGAFGGRVRVAVSGGAALEREVAEQLVGLGLPMVEGYGLTEAGPVVAASPMADYQPGSVGFALPGIEIRRAADGELEVNSPAAMLGYWRRPEDSEAMFTADGWLRTGDLVSLEGGRLHITGRLKHILVLSNGENVNPEPIETALLGDPLIDQACVLGDGRSFLAALIVLQADEWATLCDEEGLDPECPNGAEAQAAIKARVRARLTDMPAHAQIRAFHALTEPWTLEAGLLTPTLKLRREKVKAAHADEIAALFRPDTEAAAKKRARV